ncbi:MAG: hypothetical protein FJX63_03285 [Alphaproteobacteria bacterium]|nr:hypothetical protein [Alphaproteobacteria bacterium]
MVTRLHVHAISPRARLGLLQAGGLAFPCLLGRSGTKADKREGDGATPRGLWRLCRVLFRRDRIAPPATALPLKVIARHDGWCDAPLDRNYNRPVRLPYPASHEELWRADHLYDVVVVLDHNARPRRRGGGSAVFFHLSSPESVATAGCIAVALSHMRIILALCGPSTRLAVGATGRAVPRKSPNRRVHGWRRP